MHCGVRKGEVVSDHVKATKGLDYLTSRSHATRVTPFVSFLQAPMTKRGVETNAALTNTADVLTTRAILDLLSERGVKRARIAEALGLPASRITELYKGDRRLYHDEAVKLVSEFNLDDRRDPLAEPTARLLAIYAIQQLGQSPDPESPQVLELAQDFRAFARFAANPEYAANQPALEAFLHGRASSVGKAA